ncbi:hypothetical protein BKA67DRAFT_662649 [Truncatella angustata]|uniref:IgE-binding protein n=1 Tax=Truncatella angustata TaxID=152316 RepID=A0A9P8UDJ8_9PEZI|nr:uncharacterized protein BKA67DRAFT_662649 [Truncatella angustata]KAH6647904.1 hypothetical protein BKA67DRAFT_662649 [Truncatella angustata]
MLWLSFLAVAPLASATTYRLTVFAPSTTIDGADLDASANGFYLGLSEPSTYCPIGAACPAVRGTLVYEGMTAMAVEVPGGQAIYVAPNGQVKYTQAHSAYMPQGSLLGGWFNKTVVSDCAPDTEVLDFLATDGSNRGGLMLCPGTQGFMEGTGASYQLYANTPRFNATNCLQTVGLIQHGSAVTFGAWQYT